MKIYSFIALAGVLPLIYATPQEDAKPPWVETSGAVRGEIRWMPLWKGSVPDENIKYWGYARFRGEWGIGTLRWDPLQAWCVLETDFQILTQESALLPYGAIRQCWGHSKLGKHIAIHIWAGKMVRRIGYGTLVSPVDDIYGLRGFPGMPRVENGIWSFAGGVQFWKLYLEFLYMPFVRDGYFGLPSIERVDTRDQGFLLRGTFSLPRLEAVVSTGWLERGWQIAGGLEFTPWDFLSVYAEGHIQTRPDDVPSIINRTIDRLVRSATLRLSDAESMKSFSTSILTESDVTLQTGYLDMLLGMRWMLFQKKLRWEVALYHHGTGLSEDQHTGYRYTIRSRADADSSSTYKSWPIFLLEPMMLKNYVIAHIAWDAQQSPVHAFFTGIFALQGGSILLPSTVRVRAGNHSSFYIHALPIINTTPEDSEYFMYPSKFSLAALWEITW